MILMDAAFEIARNVDKWSWYESERVGGIIFLRGSVLPIPENPFPVWKQNIRFSAPYFIPDSQNVYSISDAVRYQR